MPTTWRLSAAALDPKEGRRHVKDLVEIGPSREELLHGTQWIGSLPSSPAFKQSLHRLLEGFDAADLYSA